MIFTGLSLGPLYLTIIVVAIAVIYVLPGWLLMLYDDWKDRH